VAVVRTGTPMRSPAHTSAADPAWSRDGRWIAFVGSTRSSASALFLVRADGSGLRELTPKGFYVPSSTWSADSREIAFAHHEPTTGGSAVYVISAAGAGLHLAIPNAGGPAWGPGENAIAFTRSGPAVMTPPKLSGATHIRGERAPQRSATRPRHARRPEPLRSSCSSCTSVTVPAVVSSMERVSAEGRATRSPISRRPPDVGSELSAIFSIPSDLQTALAYVHRGPKDSADV
jgi:hypothetical protein